MFLTAIFKVDLYYFNNSNAVTDDSSHRVQSPDVSVIDFEIGMTI